MTAVHLSEDKRLGNGPYAPLGRCSRRNGCRDRAAPPHDTLNAKVAAMHQRNILNIVGPVEGQLIEKTQREGAGAKPPTIVVAEEAGYGISAAAPLASCEF